MPPPVSLVTAPQVMTASLTPPCFAHASSLSRQTKLPVTDRTAVVPVPDETRLVEPAALQAAIDKLVAAVPNGRAFTRCVTRTPRLRAKVSLRGVAYPYSNVCQLCRSVQAVWHGERRARVRGGQHPRSG